MHFSITISYRPAPEAMAGLSAVVRSTGYMGRMHVMQRKRLLF